MTKFQIGWTPGRTADEEAALTNLSRTQNQYATHKLALFTCDRPINESSERGLHSSIAFLKYSELNGF